MEKNGKSENAKSANEPVLREPWNDKDRYKATIDSLVFGIIWILFCILCMWFGLPTRNSG